MREKKSGLLVCKDQRSGANSKTLGTQYKNIDMRVEITLTNINDMMKILEITLKMANSIKKMLDITYIHI